MKLLTREQFSEAVFKRDSHKCVLCKAPAVDAHHILDRALFEDGGYYLDNGASVCAKHHIDCEELRISVEELRTLCQIKNIVVPDGMYEDSIYDKWGNERLGNRWMKGPLFYRESVQKILKKAGRLEDFTHYVKAARTMHLPWSLGMTSDDKLIRSLQAFEGKEVVVSVKMDGENTSLYRDYFHARSIDGASHPSRDWAKAKWGQIRYDIPEEWRISCENVYAQHSIRYENLSSYLYGFAVWNEKNERLHWDEQVEWLELLSIEPVPLLYRGIYDEEKIRSLWDESKRDEMEGYVVTTVEGFAFSQYSKNVGKFVRPNHVQTDDHWMNKAIIPNGLKK